MPSAQSGAQQTGLAEAIRVVRQRVVANRWIRLWLVCCNWIVVALIVAVGVLRSMRGPLIVGGAAVVVAAIATGIAAWYARPSAYDAAQRLDRESSLGDRVSTAVYFWTATDPNELMMRQRTDALEHLATIQPRELFPLQAPPKMWRAGALVAALAAICAFHSVYGPPVTRLTEKAAQSRTLATLLSPMTRAIEFARGEKKDLGELAASNDKDRQASETQKPLELPPMGQPTDAAQATATAANLNINMQQGQMPANGNGAAQGQLAKNAQAGQQAGTPANAQSASASDQQASQTPGQGQQSLGQKALQALENLMSSALSGQQNNGQSASNTAQVPNAGATSMQAMAGSAQMASAPNQAAQGQTSNSQGAQTQTTPTPGKHTGAGNGTSPWQPRDEKDPQIAGNVAKEHVELQATGYRGPPGKERADVAPGTAQIPLQDVSPQTVTTVNGAGQDSVPPRYRQYVQDYFQRSGK
ncbi:MAG TPA: hypothetical protein VIY69_06165 [Candidatus Acidoferrales bacterium]